MFGIVSLFYSLYTHTPSLAVCQFASRGDVEWFVVVGTARDLTLAPKTCSGGSLILFRMSPDGSKLEHVHSVSQSPSSSE